MALSLVGGTGPAVASSHAVTLRFTGTHTCPSQAALYRAVQRRLAPVAITRRPAAGVPILTIRSLGPGQLRLTVRDGDSVMERTLEAPVDECGALAETAALVVDGLLQSPALVAHGPPAPPRRAPVPRSTQPDDESDAEAPSTRTRIPLPATASTPDAERDAPPLPPALETSTPSPAPRTPGGTAATSPPRATPRPLATAAPGHAPQAPTPRPPVMTTPPAHAPQAATARPPVMTTPPGQVPQTPTAHPPATTPPPGPVPQPPQVATAARPLAPAGPATKAPAWELPISLVARLGAGLGIGFVESSAFLGGGNLALEVGLGPRFGVGLRAAVVNPMHYAVAPGTATIWRVPLGLHALARFPTDPRGAVVVRAGLAVDVTHAEAAGYTTSRSTTRPDPGLLVGLTSERSLDARWSLYLDLGFTALLRNESYQVGTVGTVATTPRLWLDLGAGASYRFR